VVRPVASFARTAKALTAGVNDDGRLEIFYTGTDKTLYHDWQSTPATLPTVETPNAPNNPNPWLGQTLFGKGNKANQVSLGQNSDGRLEIFYVGTGSDLFHGYQTKVIKPPHKESAADWSPQSRIAKLSAKRVTSVLDQSGFLYALYVGMKNKADYAQQSAAPSVAQPATLNSGMQAVHSRRTPNKSLRLVTPTEGPRSSASAQTTSSLISG
jgi:hypothetical protein